MTEFNRRTTLKAIATTVPLVGLGGIAAAQDDEDEPDYGDWFDGVDNYEETEDETGADEVTVAVGAGEGGLRFDPPAVRVSRGTTVVWEWTGEGGQHNVVHVPEDEVEEGVVEEGDERETEFESELTAEEGHTFEHEFELEDDEEGEATYLYVCTPHREVGMRGAVVVAEDGDGGGD